MSSLVVIVSPDGGVRALGPAALGALKDRQTWTEASAETDGVWAGTCGDGGWHEAAVVAAPDGTSGDAAGRRLVVLAGEIVNARELAHELGFEATPEPASLVARACERWGGGMFARLEGVYALAVYDPRSSRLIAGVDPRSLSTIHAVRLGGDLIVATGARAFGAHAGFAARLSEQALAELATIGWVTRGRGLFEGVVSPPLGCHLEATRERLEVVRHADDRDLLGGDLRGEAYLELLDATIRDLCREAFDSDDVLLPLTGGLDSRLLAVAVPGGRRPRCFSFGSPDDYDVHVASLVAARRRYAHTVIPVVPDYVARFARETVWQSEGRANPVSNITGSLMDRVGPGTAFVSGQGGEVGRRLLKARLLVPEWRLLQAAPLEFERIMLSRAVGHAFDPQTLAELWGARVPALLEMGAAAVRERLELTRDLDPVDRIDLHTTDTEFWEGRPWLAMAAVTLPSRAPFHTQRWLRAVLSGAVSERVDDVARLRLIARLDGAAGRIPSSLTHLSLPATAMCLKAVRRASRAVARPSAGAGAGAPGEGRGEGEGYAEPAQARPKSAVARAGAAGAGLAERLAHRLHASVDSREAWLRTESWGFVEEILGGDPLAERGVVEGGAVPRLLERCRAGEDLARPVGLLLGLELWHRAFVDGDREALQGGTT